MAGFTETLQKGKQLDLLTKKALAADKANMERQIQNVSKDNMFLMNGLAAAKLNEEKAYYAGKVQAEQEAAYYGKVNEYVNKLRSGVDPEAIVNSGKVDGRALQDAIKYAQEPLDRKMKEQGQINTPEPQQVGLAERLWGK